jgi:Mor family transcriptional regulator
MMRVSAWRGSTGNISLSMNSRTSGEKEPITYDFQFVDDGDAAWYKSNMPQPQRDLKAIPKGSVLTKELPLDTETRITEHIDHMTYHNVTMLTVTDHDFSWFAQRMFSFTSSQTDSILKYTASLIDPTLDIYASFRAVLEYSGQANRLRKPTNTENQDDSIDVTRPRTVDAISSLFVKTLVTSLHAEELDANTISKCQQDARSIETLDPSKLIPVLVALGVSHENAGKIEDSIRRKKLRSFIKSVKDLKPGDEYYFPYDKVLMANEIETELRNRVGVEAVNAGLVPSEDGNFKPSNKADRIKALHYLDKNPEFVRETQDTCSDLQNAIIAGTVAKSFLRPLEGGSKSAAQLGHQNEKPYLQQYFEDCT